MDVLSRQIPLLGKECQRKIRNSSLLVAGVGGLGCNVSQQLVRLGLGRLHLIDNGIIDAPDLNRQTLYAASDIGRKKVQVARDRLTDLGLDTELTIQDDTIDDHTHFPDKMDGVIDCLDNFPARYVLDRWIHSKGIFLIHGGVHGWLGQLTTVVPGTTLSLTQMFSGLTGEKEMIPVIGPVPAMIANLQVLEALKRICGRPSALFNKILLVDLEHLSFSLQALA